MTTTEKTILDRATPVEQCSLDEAKAAKAEVENRLETATKKRDKAFHEFKKHQKDGNPAAKQQFASALERADTELATAQTNHKKVIEEATKIVDEIRKTRATRARVYKDRGSIRTVSPSRNGMYQVSFVVGEEGSAKRSITRHCKLVGGYYVALGGMEIRA